jgi:CBS domain containing-hemolysin-like protein
MSEATTGLPMLVALAAAVVLFAVQAGLSIALLAVTSLSRVALHRLVNGSPALAFLEAMREPSSRHRAAAALMRQLCLLGGALLLALVASSRGWPLLAGLAVSAAAVVGVVVLEVFLTRLVAIWDPRRALRLAAPLVRASHLVLFPVVRGLGMVLERVAAAHPQTDEEREEEQEEEVEAFIEVGEREGILEAEEGEMMRSIVDLDETLVREIMTPRTDIVALAESTTLGEARRVILDAGHSRIPVYRDSIDNVIGVLHERDVLRASTEASDDRPIADSVRKVMFVPETLSVASLLEEMRLRKHIGLVVDEYGGVSGLVTLEDVLEEIVGEIRDEHDREEALVAQDADGSWVINASAHVDELEERFGVQFEERDFDTVGGLVVTELGRVPIPGETIRVQGLEIEVLESDRRRIRLVRIRPGHTTDEAQVGR